MENNNNKSKSMIMNKLSKNKEYMEGSTFSLNEKYDVVEMAKLINSKLLDDEWCTRIKKYKKMASGGSIKVNYTRNKIGRLEIKADNLKEKETLTTQSFMKGLCKSALCSKLYCDLDVVNSHPVMLQKLLTDYEIDCPLITKYVENRDKLMAKYMKRMNIDRDAIKTLIIRIFYGGSVNAFINEYKVDKMDMFFHKLESELKSCRTKLLSKPELLDYIIEARNKPDKGWKNEDGTALSYFLQTHECNVLMVMYKYIKENVNDKMIGALIHDGMHIDKNMLNEYGEQELIEKVQKVILHKTGFDLKLKIKDFDVIPELEDMIVVETDKEAGDIVSDKIKNDYVICNERVFMRINNVWTSNDKHIKRNLIKVVGSYNIMLSKMNEATGDVNLVNHSKMSKGCSDISKFIEPTEDDDFVDNLWTSNLKKLCFKNGYYDFKKGELVDYDIDTHTTIKINRDFEKAEPELKKEVMDKIFNPIFNDNEDQMKCWLNYIARGLAGCVEDKNWAVGIGERDCGKGVLVGLLENAFGEYCRSTNSENFLYKNNGTDSAKALSWLVPFEFRRLLLTNEITKDVDDKYRINGNILKKLASGGDKIEARVNHKDEINFKIQSRVCMFCNDLPPIEPSDAKETSYMFKYPSKFVANDDPRLGNPILRQRTCINKDGEIEKITDEQGNPIMDNIINFYEKDDDIKLWCKDKKVIDAFIEIIFDNYSNKVPVPECMKEVQEDFKDDETDESKFFDLFNFETDIDYDPENIDWLSISVISMLLKKAKINASPQKYNNWLQKKGCVKSKKTKKDGKRVNAWNYIQVNKGKKEELGMIDDDE